MRRCPVPGRRLAQGCVRAGSRDGRKLAEDGAEREIIMFEIFREEWVVTICMLSFFGLSIILRLLLGLLYQNMIKETDNMASTKNKLLKQCKLKFSNCYQLNNGVANIPVFVDKFLNRLALGPLSFETLYHLSGQTMLLSVVSAGVGICRCIMHGKMLGEILPFYIACFAELYLYFSVSTVVDVKAKRRILKTNLVDYLENHLSARINVTESDMEMLFGPQRVTGRERRRRLAGTGGGRRTVELMPIGGPSVFSSPSERGAAVPAGETSRPEGDVSARSGDASARDGGVFVRSGDVSASDGETDPRRSRGSTMSLHAAGSGDRANGREAKVSEEELEALLKEFLGT